VSQPEASVPMMSNSPTRASRVAAEVSVWWLSTAAEMKWVPTSPLVDAPHTKNDSASSQNAGTPAARRRPSNAAAMGRAGRGGGA
jgi:hypothetical protein